MIDGFFDVPKEAVSELEIEVVETEEGCRVASKAGDLFEIVNGAPPDVRRNPTLYSVFVCQTEHTGELDTRPLLDSTLGKTVGYVFPVTAFRGGEAIDGTWPRRFADIGFRHATQLPILSEFGAAISISAIRDRKVYLDEVFNDDLSIAVLSNDARDALAVAPDTLELMLFKQGIEIVHSRFDIRSDPPALSGLTAARLIKPGPRVAGEATVFLSLFKSADRDQTGVGAFLHLYQALEFCIDHIFGWDVTRIGHDTSLDTWAMKEQLSRITGETYRLSLLDARFLRALPSRAPLNQLAQACSNFLKALEIEFETDAPWFKLLYKSRNIIVHNQMKMMKATSVPLRDLITTLREAAIEILFYFSMSEQIQAA